VHVLIQNIYKRLLGTFFSDDSIESNLYIDPSERTDSVKWIRFLYRTMAAACDKNIHLIVLTYLCECPNTHPV